MTFLMQLSTIQGSLQMFLAVAVLSNGDIIM